MRRTAVSVAVVALVVVAAVAAASGVPPLVCSLRALAAAGVAYVLTLLAGRAAVSILISVLSGRRSEDAHAKGQTGERTR